MNTFVKMVGYDSVSDLTIDGQHRGKTSLLKKIEEPKIGYNKPLACNDPHVNNATTKKFVWWERVGSGGVCVFVNQI